LAWFWIGRQQPEQQTIDLARTVRQVALDLSPLIAEKDINFGIETQPARVQAHEWMLGDLPGNHSGAGRQHFAGEPAQSWQGDGPGRDSAPAAGPK
jgi:hypothetical protein